MEIDSTDLDHNYSSKFQPEEASAEAIQYAMNNEEPHSASSFERLHYATMESAEDTAPWACFSSTDIATISADYECMEDVGLSTSAVKVLLCNKWDTTAADAKI